MCMWAIAESLWVRMLIHCCPLAPSGMATLTAQWPGGGGAPSGVPGGRAIVVSPPYRAALDKWGTEREAEGHLYI